MCAMKTNVEKVLEMLGFNVSDIENEPEFNLLEDLLSSIDPENVISTEEVELLENAEIAGIGEVQVLNLLKKHGIECDDLDADEDDLQYIESKLSYYASDVWDSIICDLRKLQKRMERVVQGLKEKSYNSTFKILTQDCENEWKQIDLCFDLVFKDLQELNGLTKNPKNSEVSELFFTNFNTEVDKFIEYANHCIDNYTKTPGLNLSTGAENDIKDCTTSNNSENIFNRLSSLQSRLASNLYQVNLKYAGIEKENLLQASGAMESLKDEINTNKNEEYLLSSLTFCEKWAELQIKQNVVLPVFEENKKRRERILSSSNNLVNVLKKEVELQHLVSFVMSLWNQDHNVISELVVECKQLLDQEIINVVSRADCLNEVKREYESFFGSDEYHNCTLIEKLNRLVNKHYPYAENKYLRSIIEEKENKLCCLLNNQRLCLMNSKNNVSDIDKCIQELLQNLNSNLELLSQVQDVCHESSKVLEVRKEEVKEVTDQLMESPLCSSLRLMWVYFLTGQKKLFDLREAVDAISPDEVPGTSVSFGRSVDFVTSTPKDAVDAIAPDEVPGTPVSFKRSIDFVTSTPKENEG